MVFPQIVLRGLDQLVGQEGALLMTVTLTRGALVGAVNAQVKYVYCSAVLILYYTGDCMSCSRMSCSRIKIQVHDDMKIVSFYF